MITPLVRIPLATSGTHLSSSHLFLFLFFSPPYLLPPTTLSSSTGGDGAWWWPHLPPSLARGGVGRAVLDCSCARRSRPGGARLLLRAARRRWPCGPLALGPLAMARGRGARPSDHGRSECRSGAWRQSSTSTRWWLKLGVAAELHQHATEAEAGRGGATSGAGSTIKLTPFVVPTRVPLNPARAAPSVRFWRTSPTRISGANPIHLELHPNRRRDGSNPTQLAPTTNQTHDSFFMVLCHVLALCLSHH